MDCSFSSNANSFSHKNLAGASSYSVFPWSELSPKDFRSRLVTSKSLSCGTSSSSSSPDVSDWQSLNSSDFKDVLKQIKATISSHLLSRLIENNGDGDPSSNPADQDNRDSASASPRRKNTKKVCFADEMGFDLTTVRIFCDSFCRLSSSNKLLNSKISAKQATCFQPSFLLNFSQPSSCNLTFKESLKSSFVLLENIEIKDGVVIGEIQARNLAYEKFVYVRYTGSSWNSFSDVRASYIPRPEPKFPGFDAFEFQFPVPLEASKDGCVEFAIFYVVNGRTFWDNNGGKNYEVKKMAVSSTMDIWSELSWQDHVDTKIRPNTTDQAVFDVFREGLVIWSEFTGWKCDTNSTHPYW